MSVARQRLHPDRASRPPPLETKKRGSKRGASRNPIASPSLCKCGRFWRERITCPSSCGSFSLSLFGRRVWIRPCPRARPAICKGTSAAECSNAPRRVPPSRYRRLRSAHHTLQRGCGADNPIGLSVGANAVEPRVDRATNRRVTFAHRFLQFFPVQYLDGGPAILDCARVT
jgi:hypothetical protein